MIELLILASITVVVLAVQAHGINAERAAWREERRFLINRAIARHVGEIVALEREDTRKNQDPTGEERVHRPLIEGLS